VGAAKFVSWHIVNGLPRWKDLAEEEIGTLVGDGWQVASMSITPETEFSAGQVIVLLVSPVHVLLGSSLEKSE
jgi:hypothetical protein